MWLRKTRSPARLRIALIAFYIFSLVLLTGRILVTDSTRYIFLYWNALLAVIPVFLAMWLVHRIKTNGWLKIKQVILTIVWLSFLPNSFYLLTDLLHLRPTYEASYLFDITMLSSFMINGLILGFISIFMVHKQIVKRMDELRAYSLVATIILVCSFAMYLGRFTRWNTWDLLLQPAGLLFDVSDRVINPGAHGETYSFTFLLFAFLFSLYVIIWESSRYLSRR